jgi:tetratricopeptide (TPR) repeat protein
MADVLKLQADAAVAIAQEIQAYVTQEERRRLASAPRVQPAAYEEYLLGRHSLLPGTDQVTSKQAVEHFERAIQLQPDYADAYAGLSMASQDVGNLSAARVAAQKALDLDPDVSEAHSAMAGIRFEEWDWQAQRRNIAGPWSWTPIVWMAAYATQSSCGRWAGFLRRSLSLKGPPRGIRSLPQFKMNMETFSIPCGSTTRRYPASRGPLNLMGGTGRHSVCCL